ncbi:hypothetical protein [Ponticaulis sp.]|uniref:hypothetical protein n=1 Tax=Ponticaulis sp. TaxID=2020902 RepID=UPI000C520412|nr:hypothetical protein [Ponticaulis sp.]MAJ09862.1 hypothetical protein [Ponticaulis sp.]RPG18475.1 MAG: hypothetical protein CBC85_001800 [Hyphomonadaceae bacterium TMED125]
MDTALLKSFAPSQTKIMKEALERHLKSEKKLGNFRSITDFCVQLPNDENPIYVSLLKDGLLNEGFSISPKVISNWFKGDIRNGVREAPSTPRIEAQRLIAAYLIHHKIISIRGFEIQRKAGQLASALSALIEPALRGIGPNISVDHEYFSLNLYQNHFTINRHYFSATNFESVYYITASMEKIAYKDIPNIEIAFRDVVYLLKDPQIKNVATFIKQNSGIFAKSDKISSGYFLFDVNQQTRDQYSFCIREGRGNISRSYLYAMESFTWDNENIGPDRRVQYFDNSDYILYHKSEKLITSYKASTDSHLRVYPQREKEEMKDTKTYALELLYEGCRDGKGWLTEEAIQQGADVNAVLPGESDPPILVAAMSGGGKSIQLLLEQPELNILVRNSDGQTPSDCLLGLGSPHFGSLADREIHQAYSEGIDLVEFRRSGKKLTHNPGGPPADFEI